MLPIAAYIPAKGQSRGVPSKNVAQVGGRPLVMWSVDTARQLTERAEHIFVSTDSPAIADAVSQSGVTVLSRPTALARDAATVSECLVHDLSAIAAKVGEAAVIVVLLPTTPFRDISAYRTAIAAFAQDASAKSLVSVSRYPAPPAQALTLDPSQQRLQPVYGSTILNKFSQRQQHAVHCYPDGGLYAVRLAHFRQDPRFFFDHETRGLMSRGIGSVDIDEPDDLFIAQSVALNLSNAP